MNRLTLEKRTQIIGLLVEGTSLRATSRLADVSINTVTKLLVDIGNACQTYHDEHVRGVQSRRVQCDEIWSFIYSKDKNIPENKRGKHGIGSIWTWVGIDADSKLAISWLVGNRDAAYARVFMQDIASRLTNRVQLTTDGLKAYLFAVEEVFGADIDFAQLIKLYGKPIEGDHRYSPAECTGTEKHVVTGRPHKKHISTSYVERQNLTMRMNMRRFTRLTNAFSKKVENHAHAVALHFMYYNFVRIHKTLRVTPAMQAGITSKLWEIEDLARLLEG
ncbi:DDE-type integrase/transposase/recombinase [Sphingobacteriales bacterium CHB3]|nr:DDE-type integrase/transposase/recombinase [Sphingobacteriales bacterium CHB3]